MPVKTEASTQRTVEQELTITGKTQTAEDAARQEALQRSGAIPRHVAIIMDGNGRWAKERGDPRILGHYEGVESVRDITEACAQLGVAYLTLYTFSVENWHRPPREVNALMKLLIRTIRRERKTLRTNNIRLQAIGELTELPRSARAALQETIDATAENTSLTLILALSYSGRWDITQAARMLARRVQQGDLDPETIDEALVAQALDSAGLPDPDLLIRTGGEYRVSNFLLWQLAYTEMVITDLYWPAFRREQLYEAISEFQHRDRRFGRLRG